MFRRKHHICCAVQSVGARCVNRQLVACAQSKINLCTAASANPVFLLNLYLFNIIKTVKVINQALSIFRYAEHPLAFKLLHNLAAAALANAVYNLLIRKSALAARAPVYRHFLLVSKSFFKHFKENPLRPLIIGRIGRVYLAVPVKRKAEAFELTLEVCNVIFCNL